eukprot:sb/3472828/
MRPICINPVGRHFSLFHTKHHNLKVPFKSLVHIAPSSDHFAPRSKLPRTTLVIPTLICYLTLPVPALPADGPPCRRVGREVRRQGGRVPVNRHFSLFHTKHHNLKVPFKSLVHIAPSCDHIAPRSKLPRTTYTVSRYLYNPQRDRIGDPRERSILTRNNL